MTKSFMEKLGDIYFQETGDFWNHNIFVLVRIESDNLNMKIVQKFLGRGNLQEQY